MQAKNEQQSASASMRPDALVVILEQISRSGHSLGLAFLAGSYVALAGPPQNPESLLTDQLSDSTRNPQ